MNLVIRGCQVLENGSFTSAELLIRGGKLMEIGPHVSDSGLPVLTFEQAVVLPGLVDVHVHLREPGFSYKATVASETRAAARGGFTALCAMPNLDPVPDSAAHLEEELALLRRDAAVTVRPYGAITVGERGQALADLEAMAPYVAGFSDDGKGVQAPEMMRAAMVRAKALDKLIVAHCEDESLLRGGYIHDGTYAKAHGHRGICSESEWGPIARDAALAAETGCGYHVCHVSAKESVDVIRRAKAQGVDITAETGPHYLLLTDEDLQEDGRFKMNPPIRAQEDREALLAGILDGTLDMIVTDHAPHSAEEKSRGLEKSLMGVVGLETSFPLLYTYLVKKGVLSLDKLLELMCYAPARRFGLPAGLTIGQPANFAVWDLESEYTIDPADFLSMGKATPFTGWKVCGDCLMTIANGNIAYRKEDRHEA